MLKSLKLKNLALIEIIEINFEKGLNVFTGESGSGKSLILDSLNSLFGGTNIPLKHLIRPGSNECSIEARFKVSASIRNLLMEKNFSLAEDYLVITRNSFRKGSKIISKFFINDKSINKKSLEQLGCYFVDFAGQKDIYLFNSQDYLRKIIDDFGSKELNELNKNISKTFLKLNMLKKEINSELISIQKDKDNFFANTKILQVLEEANLTDKNEIILLKEKQLKLSNNYELKNTLNAVLVFLSDFNGENNSVCSQLLQSIKQLNKLIKYDKKLNVASEKLINTHAEIEDVVYLITKYLESIEIEECSLDEVQTRLFKLKNLEKAFSLELSSLIKKRNELRRIPSIDFREEEIKNLREKHACLDIDFKKMLKEQSIKRKKIASNLETAVNLTLRELGLMNSCFAIEFQQIEPNLNGSDQIQFLFSANPDQELAPLTHLISGGEMSRFLLALKLNISNLANTLFLDEVDNGLSGKSLLSTINLIKKISIKQQTLCITHHPMLAASSDVHYKVEKHLLNGSTSTSLTKLISIKQKQNELAELIGGGFEDASNYALTLLNKAAA